jgi:hypothetical protein
VQHGRGQPISHAGLVRHLTTETTERIADLLTANSSFILTIRSAGVPSPSPPLTPPRTPGVTPTS